MPLSKFDNKWLVNVQDIAWKQFGTDVQTDATRFYSPLSGVEGQFYKQSM